MNPTPPGLIEASASGHGQVVVNTGAIGGNLHVVQTPSTPLAEYEIAPYRRHCNVEALEKPVFQRLGFAAVAVVLGFLNDSLDLMQKFGVGQTISNFNTWALFGLGIVIAVFAMRDLHVFGRLRWSKTVQRNDVLYQREPDGAVSENRARAKCPVPGCPGHLTVERLPPNAERYKVAGRCSERPEQHLFDFHLETMRGSAIERITPVRPGDERR